MLWQVDDLKSIEELEDYIDATAVIMLFASKGYVRRAHGPRTARRLSPAGTNSFQGSRL